jgi:hypothetical protein
MRQIISGERRIPHEASDECQARHCYTHHVDEAAPIRVWPLPAGPYLVCGECFHVYPTRFALWRDYTHGHRQSIRSEWAAHRPTADDPSVCINLGYSRPALVWMWLSSWRARPGRIRFCPHCMHDF